MPNSKKSTTPDATAFIAGLQSLLGSLPSEEQRREAVTAFDELIVFLTSARDKFNALPTQEDAAKLQPSLVRLEELFRYTEKSTDEGRTAKRSGSRAASTRESDVDASVLAEGIKRLPEAEIRSHLDNKQYPAAVVKAVAVALGLKPGSKETKAGLINRIGNYIENARMSDRLAGRTDSEWIPREVPEPALKEGAANAL